MTYTVAQANLYLHVAEKIEQRKAVDQMRIMQGAFWGTGK